MIEALRIHDFRLLWFARLVSQLGSWLLVVAVPADVFTLTGSLAATGLALAAEFLPSLLLGPIAGVLVDRWDRRRVMIGADLARAAAVALLFAVRAPHEVWLVYLALVAENVGTVVFQPAAQAHTPVVVGTGPALTGANALNSVTDGTVRLVGAPLGGVLFGLGGLGSLVWLDIATYLVSAATIAFSATTTASTMRTSGGVGRVLAELRQGLRFIRANRTVGALLVTNTSFLAANACLTALLIPYGVTSLGGSGRIGVVISALGIGFLLGAPVMRALVDRMPPGYPLGGMLASAGIGFMLLFSATALVPALLAAILVGMAGSAALGTIRTALQRATPNELLGRTSSVFYAGEAAATLAGAVAGPALAQAWSITWTAYLAGTATVLTGVMGVIGALFSSPDSSTVDQSRTTPPPRRRRESGSADAGPTEKRRPAPRSRRA